MAVRTDAGGDVGLLFVAAKQATAAASNFGISVGLSHRRHGYFAFVRLPQIEFSERTAIALPVTMENVVGWPLNKQLAPSEKRPAGTKRISLSRNCFRRGSRR